MKRHWVSIVLLFLYLITVTGLLYYSFRNWGYDDPFITYRYAANLEHGLGFVYNPGERVQSTTTPLFTIFLALLGNLWHDLPHLANLLGAFSLALGGICLWDLARSWKVPLVGWCGLLLYPTFPLLVMTLGSETPLYIAFCLGSFALYARRRFPLMAVFIALAVLTRPDGILVALILSIHFLMRVHRPIPWLALTLFIGITIPWFAFAWGYFGSPIPATLAVKQHQGSMAVSQRFAPGLLTTLTPFFRWPYLVEVVLAVGGLAVLFWRDRRWTLFLTWTLLYFLSYSALGVSRYFWYYAPLVPGLIVLIGLGISGIRKMPALNRKVSISNTFSVVLLLLFVFAQLYNLWNLRQRPDSRLVIYSVAGEWIRENTPTDVSVGTLEVGIIGFYAQRRMIDFAGLIRPELSDQFTKNVTYEDSAIWSAEHYHPNFLVLQEGIFPRLEKGYVSQYCQVIQYFPAKPYGYSMDLFIYSCK